MPKFERQESWSRFYTISHGPGRTKWMKGNPDWDGSSVIYVDVLHYVAFYSLLLLVLWKDLWMVKKQNRTTTTEGRKTSHRNSSKWTSANSVFAHHITRSSSMDGRNMQPKQITTGIWIPAFSAGFVWIKFPTIMVCVQIPPFWRHNNGGLFALKVLTG